MSKTTINGRPVAGNFAYLAVAVPVFWAWGMAVGLAISIMAGTTTVDTVRVVAGNWLLCFLIAYPANAWIDRVEGRE